MKLIARHRHQRPKRPRISITEAEISADLHYPASAGHRRAAARRTGLR